MHIRLLIAPLLLILAIGSTTLSQTFRFPLHQGNIWQYREPPPPPYDYDVIEARVIGDTLMPNGRIYTLINWYNYGYPTPIWNHFYRQAGDTVFEYLAYSVNNGNTNEVIRYNFADTLGDTVTTYAVGSDTVITTVTDVGVMSVAGQPAAYKTFYIRFKHSSMFWLDKITDGLGLLYEEVEAGFELNLVGSIIDSVQLGTILSVSPALSTLPSTYSLEQNYPNPFNPSTTIRYVIPTREFVSLSVYDMLGRLVQVLVQGVQPPGTHSTIWRANYLPSGIYFCRLETPTFSATRKLILEK